MRCLMVIGAMLVGLSGSIAGQTSAGQFVLRSGNDTIAVEQFNRTAGLLKSESLIKVVNARISFDMTIAPDGTVPRVVSRYWQATDSAGAQPRQTATFTIRGDSVIAEISAGGAPQTQRLVSKSGAIPYINPSIAVMEVVLERARKTGALTAEIPIFAVAGGQTFAAMVKAGDSVVVTMTGGDMRFVMDRAGRIRGGRIPAQNLVIERSDAGGPGALAVEKPDYSAPANAPYSAIDVTVPTPMGHTLAGTLTLPKGAAPNARVPAVVTITGSGAQDRDEAIPIVKGYRLFREIADSLSRIGIAVLRMDDRGYGGSGGDVGRATSADFAEDIRAGLAYLRSRPEIDGTRLGLVGHSEGGIIAPMVAAKESDLRGIVLLAGTAYAGDRILRFQLRNNFSNDTSRSVAQRDSMIAGIPAMIDSLKQMPWMDYFLTYDPLTTARRVKTPVLILQGATDQQVTADQAPELERAFKQAGNPDVTARVFPNLNHLFVYDPNGFPGGYTRLPSSKVDSEVIGALADWLVNRLQVRAGTP